MAWFDMIPNEVLLKIFSYLTIDDLCLSVRDVCIRWRRASQANEIWKNLCFSPKRSASQEEIASRLRHMQNLRIFEYYGTCNVIGTLSEYCTRITVLRVSKIETPSALLKITMERLTALRELGILISLNKEGCELTHIIGQSRTLDSLALYSSGTRSVTEGLLKPIADGCPNLNNLALKCGGDNYSDEEICYLLECKKRQLDAYEHWGRVFPDFFVAINECTNLEKLVFVSVENDSPFDQIPPITKLRKLTKLVFTCCKFPVVKKIPLTLFPEVFSQLSYIGLPLTLGNINALMNKILPKSPSLTHLTLEGNSQLHCKGFKNIRSCKNLACLDVSYCSAFGKEAMKCVAEGCPQLQHLNVSSIPIPQKMFRQILKCTKLNTLLMRNCDLTDINLNLIPTNVTSLLYLYIGPQFQLADNVRYEMKRAMPQLVIKQASVSCDASEYYGIKRDLTQNVPF
ncbi:uncharacterized protein LOC117282320 [Cryptotermes secundus]|uniref:uncharacterized protein LOC117282320 n=1 Tax=Cryptotermes secundus TaxID=105785 RepID=UPI001454C9F1|nr:uncharacterized protein LOC117282320 [Cryptotermes secundus]